MRKKIILIMFLVVSFVMAGACVSKVQAQIQTCNGYDYKTFAYGCKDRFYDKTKNTIVKCSDVSSSVAAQNGCVSTYDTNVWRVCTYDDYSGNKHGCSDSWRQKGAGYYKSCDDGFVEAYLRGEVSESCVSTYSIKNWTKCNDFEFGEQYGCKLTYTENGQTNQCTDNDFFLGNYGCQNVIDPNMEIVQNIKGNVPWWQAAGNFFSGGTALKNEALDELSNFVKFIGNIIFIIVTVVLGVKYIWGSVESKSDVKESLATLAIAALVFYGYSTISNLFMAGNNLAFIDTSSYVSTGKQIYSTILYACNFFAIGGLVYVGVRYMMAGAEGKAELKTKGVPLVLGVIMVYATLTFLSFILSIL